MLLSQERRTILYGYDNREINNVDWKADVTDLNLYWIKGALAFVCFSFWLRVL